MTKVQGTCALGFKIHLHRFNSNLSNRKEHKNQCPHSLSVLMVPTTHYHLTLNHCRLKSAFKATLSRGVTPKNQKMQNLDGSSSHDHEMSHVPCKVATNCQTCVIIPNPTVSLWQRKTSWEMEIASRT